MTVDTHLLSSCARAATAAEARFRIDRPIAPSRAGRVIALDEQAAESVVLRGIDGGPATLADELASASVVVMVATNDAGASCAYALGKACWERGVQTAGLVLGNGTSEGTAAAAAVAALRPHARVLLPDADELDVVDLLTALRV